MHRQLVDRHLRQLEKWLRPLKAGSDERSGRLFVLSPMSNEAVATPFQRVEGAGFKYGGT
jgi:hypothetical protein